MVESRIVIEGRENLVVHTGITFSIDVENNFENFGQRRGSQHDQFYGFHWASLSTR